MIDGKKIAELRMKLIPIKVREASGVRNIDDIIRFFELFSGDVGELMAMADAFQKIRGIIDRCGAISPEPRVLSFIQGFIREYEDLLEQKEQTTAK